MRDELHPRLYMRETMKRAVLISGDFVQTGGMDMPNFAVARELAECGVSVQLVAFRVASDLLGYANVDWHRVPKPFRSYFLGSAILDRVGRRVARKAIDEGARVIVNGGNCQVGDVNWVHYVHAAYRAALPPSLLRSAKSLVARGVDLVQERDALRRAKVVIANSERTRRDLVERVGIEDKKIRTIYYGIDAERFSPPSNERKRELKQRLGWEARPHIAFVGALGDRRKGFDTLFAAWTSLCADKRWDCDLVVVGRGAELAAWQERARARNVSERIRFLGFRSDVPDVLAACDALVAPTRYEAYGLGVQEALCTGIPAIVSADAGVAERYPAELSELLLQDPTNVGALEERLRHWRDRRDRLGEATFALSQHLRQRTWQVMARDVAALLD